MGENLHAKTWQDRLACFDFEVTAHDWLLVIKPVGVDEYICFHNDPDGVIEFLEYSDFIFVGYNNKHYDNYILKGILNHYTPEEIKQVNDWIIGGENGWEYPFEQPYVKIPPTTDLMLDLTPIKSLKELEGNMKMDIRESTIDFNIDHPWTKEEFDEMLFYCKHDVASTEKVLENRMGYLEAKATLAEMCGIDVETALYKTNGQMVALSLGAEKQEWDDEKDYVYPNSVDFTMVPPEIIHFFDRFKETGTAEKFKYELADCPHTYGLGGIHGALPCYMERSDEDRVIINQDVTSYYPSLLIFYNYLSRNVKDKEVYKGYYHDRLEYKAKGDKPKANALKLPLNTAYGVSLQQFNDMFDPLMGRSTCITGQVLLTQLIVELNEKVEDFILIQSNTDGIMYSLPRSEKAKADAIVRAWSDKTLLEMEEDVIDLVVQKDVNNYIIVKDDGSIKNKGGYVSNYPKGSFDSNSLSICHKAIVEYFVNNVPIEETINNCDDPFEFQLIAKTGGTYDKTIHYIDGEEIEVQRANRIYAVRDSRYGAVKKVKKQYLTLDEDGERRYYINGKGNRTYKKQWETDDGGDYFITKATVQNCPENAFIDNSGQITIDRVDKPWYIILTEKRINDFLGIKEKKGKKKMAKKTNNLFITDEQGMTTLNEPLARVQLYDKIFKVGEWLAKQPYEYDGYNSGQSFEYVTSHTYRALLGKACREVGLVFKCSISNRVFERLETTKNMNLTTIFGIVSFIDPESGLHEDYPVMADGADNLDKGIFKAETMLIKYFVLNNFLLPKQQDEIDPENDKSYKDEEVKEKEEKPKQKAPATSKQREEAKEEVVADKYATKKYVEEIAQTLSAIQDVKGTDYQSELMTDLNDVLNDKKKLIKTKAVSIMADLEEVLDEITEEPTGNNEKPCEIDPVVTLAETMIEIIKKIQSAGGVDKKGKPYGSKTMKGLEDYINGKVELTLDKANVMFDKIESKAKEMGV